MADIESTISSILSDPDAMKQIQELGKSLGLTNGNTADSPVYTPPQNQHTEKSRGFDISSIASLLTPAKESHQDTDTIKSLARFLPLINGFNNDDEATRLLCALKPFLSPQRQRRLEDASKMLRVMRMLPIIKSQGLF